MRFKNPVMVALVMDDWLFQKITNVNVKVLMSYMVGNEISFVWCL